MTLKEARVHWENGLISGEDYAVEGFRHGDLSCAQEVMNAACVEDKDDIGYFIICAARDAGVEIPE